MDGERDAGCQGLHKQNQRLFLDCQGTEALGQTATPQSGESGAQSHSPALLTRTGSHAAGGALGTSEERLAAECGTVGDKSLEAHDSKGFPPRTHQVLPGQSGEGPLVSLQVSARWQPEPGPPSLRPRLLATLHCALHRGQGRCDSPFVGAQLLPELQNGVLLILAFLVFSILTPECVYWF